MPHRVDVDNLSIQQIADDLIPRDTAAAQAVAAEALSRARRAQHIAEDFSREHYKDEAALTQLYEVVDRLRVAAKDVQNYVDRSLMLSQAFVPMVESSYPCAAGNKAMLLAHSLHMSLGRAKEAVGGGASGAMPPTPGVADLLADSERKLGRITGNAPNGLQPIIEEKDDEEEAVLQALMPIDPATVSWFPRLPQYASRPRWPRRRQLRPTTCLLSSFL
eukprot:gb/GFBE01054600.1/.p1 GENE.gb/GFBE01054600.1/~~gb/GFBE01054600.1/.p1  ORF type:complete len:219 (+),score=37.44 gb/GFBE01054600.1/:1-657(+)